LESDLAILQSLQPSSVAYSVLLPAKETENALVAAESQDNLSLQDVNSPPHVEAHELEATERPVELAPSPPAIPESTDSSTELWEPANPSPTVDLREYPRQPVLENLELKRLNQVPENGGLE
jgi:hypothetical protein